MEPVSLAQIATSTRGTLVGTCDPDLTVTGITIDSRTVQENELFCAIPGESHDGHQFIAEAEFRGAGCCLVQRGISSQGEGPRIEVDNTRQALLDLAAWYRLQRDAMVIGVTGSVGKTTTREMVHSALSEGYEGIRSEKNYNNELGLPLTLLNLSRRHEYVVLEMGARRLGDIRLLAEIAQPEIGIITAIAPAHLETFGSLKGVLQAKGELFEALPKSGLAILAGDDELTRTLAQRAACKVILVGQGSHNQIKATQIEVGLEQLRFKVGSVKYEVPVTGRHYLTSALAAIAVAKEIGLANDAIQRGLRSFVPVDGRCQIEYLGSWTLINDTYNSSPASMIAACQMLAELPFGRKRIMVTGDMLELGDESPQFHYHIGEQVAHSQIDCLIAFGPQADDIVSGALGAGLTPDRIATCRELDALLTVLDCWLEHDSAVLVKGSRGMRMERICEWIRQQALVNTPPHWKAVA